MADYSIKLFEIAHRKVQNNNFSQFKHLKLHLFPKLLVIARWYLKKKKMSFIQSFLHWNIFCMPNIYMHFTTYFEKKGFNWVKYKCVKLFKKIKQTK